MISGRRSCDWVCNLVFGCCLVSAKWSLFWLMVKSEIGLDQDISIDVMAVGTTETILLFVMRL